MRLSRLARVVVVLFGVLIVVVPTMADEGWIIDRLDIRYDIQPDGWINVGESIDVDFRGLKKHGIFRDVASRQSFDDAQYREYDVNLVGVLNAEGRRHQVDILSEDDLRRFKIGDPKQEISGKQTYRIAYRLGGVLNAQAAHDEFYWNATGKWPVTMAQASITVRVPSAGIERVECYQGFAGSTEPCRSNFTGTEAVFTATRPLVEGEQMTIVTGFRKGLVPVAPPRLTKKPRDILRSFDHTNGHLAAMAAGFMAVLGGIGTMWWKWGRDRRFVALQRATADAAEERVPILGGRPVAVEFQPPEKLRPAQMGLLLDERADTLDVTATIIDLAVRGYLKITEVEKPHWFSSRDWQLDRLKQSDTGLLLFERIVFNGLFEHGESTTLSALKTKFHDDLEKAKDALYTDAVDRKWFPKKPSTVRLLWALAGVGVAVAGVVLTIWLGRWWGFGLFGLPVILGGLVMAVAARAMPRRTAIGQQLTWRTLGFLRYIKTAEVNQQAFAERANLFTEYLPYAIVFRCVDRWARAFQGVDLQAATAGWYVGSSQFNASTFASHVSGFSSSVSTVIASTPGGSGGSGFSGGSSGGGGGGGGGGSW